MGVIFGKLFRFINGSANRNINEIYEENRSDVDVNIKVSNWIIKHLPHFQNCEFVQEVNPGIHNEEEELFISNREKMQIEEDRNINIELAQSFNDEFIPVFNEEREEDIHEETSDSSESAYADALTNTMDIKLHVLMEEKKTTASNFEEEVASQQIQTRSKTLGKPGVKFLKKEHTHPPTSVMVIDAIKALKKRNGAKMEDIEQYMAENYNISINRLRYHIRNFLEKAVSTGVLEKVQRDDCDAFIIKKVASSGMKNDDQ